MNISVETTSGLERKMRIDVPPETVQQAIEKRFNQLNRQVKLKGFRPGKVPAHELEKRYGDQVRQEVQEDFLRKGYTEGLKEHSLSPVAQPKIDAEDWQMGQALSFTATFEIFPEIELAEKPTLNINKPKADIKDSDIDAVIERLRKQHVHFHDVDRKAELGDQVEITFSGEHKKEKVEGASGEKVKVQLGEGQLLPDFEKKLVGLKPGANKKFKVKMPKDYYQENLAGETIKYECEVHRVGAPHYPDVNDDFAKKLDVEGGLEGLKTEIKSNMERELAATIDAKVREQLVDQWIDSQPIDVPTTLVEAETKHRQQGAAAQLGIKDPEQWPAAEPFAEPAKRAVHFGLLMQRLIEKEQLTPDSAKMEARMRDIASRYSASEEILKQYRTNPGLQQQLIQQVLEDQAVDWLLTHATVTDVEQTFADVMDLPKSA